MCGICRLDIVLAFRVEFVLLMRLVGLSIAGLLTFAGWCNIVCVLLLLGFGRVVSG